jgi:hypothetical protein
MAFVHCESNSITFVSKSFGNDPNISFRILQKWLNHISFQKLLKWSPHWLSHIAKATQSHWFSKNFGNDPNINFCILWKLLKHISFTSPFTIHLYSFHT